MSANLPARRRAASTTPLAKLAAAANREHVKALSTATHAVEHAVRAGELLAKARDLCDAGQWTEFIESNFNGSLRTAQKYMRLARNIQQLRSQGPIAALRSQSEAAKALTAICRGDDRTPHKHGMKKTRRPRRVNPAHALELVVNTMDTLAALERQLGSVEPPTYYARQALQTVNRARSHLEERYRELTAGLQEAGHAGATDAPRSDVPVVPDEPACDQLTAPEALQGGYDAIA
jgi:hypothetical protein